MRCYNCGFEVSGGEICPNCGIEIATFLKTGYISDKYYNEGLEKASVRDLSGAVSALHGSLKFNKNNIDARNLLGLCYYEMGEIVSALTQWVVSKNLRQEMNPADRYLAELRNHPDKLETMNKAIRKYNIGLRLSKRKNTDVAIIQLKKAVQLNPRLLRARNLLALLYIEKGDLVRARKELNQCALADQGSTLASRYLQEIDTRELEEKGGRRRRLRKRGKAKKDAETYVSGNETIIRPTHRFSFGGTVSLLSIAIGLGVGALAAYYLIVPTRLMENTLAANERIAAISEESDIKNARLNEIEGQIESVEREREELKEVIEEYKGKDEAIDEMGSLMAAASDALNGEEDIETLAEYLDGIDEQEITESGVDGYASLYKALSTKLGPQLSVYYYNAGNVAFRAQDYETAMQEYEMAYQYDQENGDALYNLAEATRLSGNTDDAKKLYDQVIDGFPGTRKASNSEARLRELRNAGDT